MARLPAGWVFIPIIKNGTEIEIKEMELVTCKDCKWSDQKDRKCKHADMGSPFPRNADFFCAWGEEIKMAQYCRYCNNLVTGNGTYCTLHMKELTDSYAKGTNKCKDFEFNPIDAYGENEKGYMPHKPKQDDGNQIRMEELL